MRPNILEYKQMEKLLKEALNTSKLNFLGQFGGYIAKEAAGYEIDGRKNICKVRSKGNLPHVTVLYLFLLLNRQSKSLKESLLAYKHYNGLIQLEYQTQ